MKPYLFAVLIVAIAAGSAVGMPLCNYHAPVSDLATLGMTFSYHYYNDPYGRKDRDINAGEFQIHYSHLYDSPDFGYSISAANDMTISVLSLSSYNATAAGSLKRYFSPEAAYFGFAGVTGKTATAYEKIGISVNLGLGYGRFTNVTPLAKATKIDNYLVNHHSLVGHLSDVDLLAVANEIDNRATYHTTADLIAALQEIITGSGLVKQGGLNALDLSEIARIVDDNSHPRYCGGEAKVGLTYEIINPQGGPNELLATAGFNYAFTATPSSQFLIKGSLSGSADIVHNHQLELGLTYDYLLSSILILSGGYTFSQTTYNGELQNSHRIALNLTISPVKTATVTLEMRFSHEPYYLEWSQEVRLSIGMELL